MPCGMVRVGDRPGRPAGSSAPPRRRRPRPPPTAARRPARTSSGAIHPGTGTGVHQRLRPAVAATGSGRQHEPGDRRGPTGASGHGSAVDDRVRVHVRHRGERELDVPERRQRALHVRVEFGDRMLPVGKIRARSGRHPCCARRPRVLLAITGAEAIPARCPSLRGTNGVVLEPVGRAVRPPGTHSGVSVSYPLNGAVRMIKAVRRQRPRPPGAARTVASHPGRPVTTVERDALDPGLVASAGRPCAGRAAARPARPDGARAGRPDGARRAAEHRPVGVAGDGIAQPVPHPGAAGARRARRREARGAARRPAANCSARRCRPRRWTSALDKLEGLALVRGTDTIHMPSAVLAVLGPYPAGLGAPGQADRRRRRRAAVAALDPTSRGILDRLTTGIPRGATDPKSAIARAVTALITGRAAAPGRCRHGGTAPRGRDGAARRSSHSGRSG